MHEWIGPVGRVAMGLVAGAAVMGLGELRTRVNKAQGVVLIALGSAAVLMTVFAARTIYEFFDPISSLGIMALVIVFIAYSSLKNDSKPLAVVGLVLGSVIPLMTGTEFYSETWLFPYLFILTAGFLWLVSYSGWKVLNVIALVAVALYSAPYIFNLSYISDPMAWAVAVAFGLLFFATNVSAMVSTKKSEGIDLLVAGGSGVLAMAWIISKVPYEMIGLVTAGVALVLAVLAFLIYKLTDLKSPMYVYAGVAISMLLIATGYEFGDENTMLPLVSAYTIEAVALSVLASRILKNPGIGQKVAWLMAIPVYISLGSVFSTSWNEGFLHNDFWILLVAGLGVLAVGLYYHFFDRGEGEQKALPPLNTLAFGISTGYAIVLVWMSTHAALGSFDTATAVSLVIYTLGGLVANVYGRLTGGSHFRVAGAVVLGGVVARLLLVEVWDMALAGRIVTFFVIGILLILAAFISGRRLKSGQ